ncbi:hypothetical protein IVB30_13130 [Bradyrhizobium sp. 200]|uniref:hypothetical protein n=1 Tax=Bradyrhizobium sp. 200 TaxID=2782665 RepID=UPI001FFEFA39|nr:hypothetical protein [Bradyrhizobium sp. 200]UPJ52211.1 hypothetical protein IVB30_13130 [Bradyrhizobium sp. 200]
MIRLFPDGFSPLFRAAAALPALLVMPVLESVPVALPVVVPPVEDPVVVLLGAALLGAALLGAAPLVAAPPVAVLPPVEPPLDCANAYVPVNANAVANPNVASFMIAPFLAALEGKRGRPARVPVCHSQLIAVPGDFHWPQFGNRNDTLAAPHGSARRRQSIFHTPVTTEDVRLNLPRYQGHQGSFVKVAGLKLARIS